MTTTGIALKKGKRKEVTSNKKSEPTLTEHE